MATKVAVGSPSPRCSPATTAAPGLLDVFIRAGLDVPGELSLVGYDDSHFFGQSPDRPDHLHQDAGALARHALQLGVDMLEGER